MVDVLALSAFHAAYAHAIDSDQLHYAEQGMLVAVDEPDWPRRAGTSPLDVPEPRTDGPPTLLPDEWTETRDHDTEILSRRDVMRLRARLEAERVRSQWVPPRLEPVSIPEDDPDDLPTEEVDLERTVPLPRRRRSD